MDLRIEKKVFLVTGGSQGIGKAIVLFLLQEGASVSTCARDKVALDKLSQDVPDLLRPNLLTIGADVLNRLQMEQVVEKTIKRFGKMNGVLANAGSGTSGGVLETPGEEWRQQYSMKVDGLFNTIRPAVNELLKAEDPRIVIINGVTANRPDSEMAAVSASRAAVKQIAKMLSQALSPEICVNTINIGVIDTGRQLQKYKNCKSPLPFSEWKKKEAARRGIPLGRMGAADEVAPMAALLLSPLSSYITGASIDVSGGLNTV